MSIVNLLLYTSLALSLLAVVAGIAALVGLAVLVWRVNRPRKVKKAAAEAAFDGFLSDYKRFLCISAGLNADGTEKAPQQLAPLAFEGPGWLALMREGKPIAIKPATPLVGDPQQATCDSVEEWVWAWRDYWKPIDERTAAMYRLTVPVIE